MVEPEEDYLPISGLQHLAFCPRQWGLIHLEQAWRENNLTAEGRLLHECVDLPGQTRRGTIRSVRGMWLRSNTLGLTGRADVVEFNPQPYPVEYKRGKHKPNDCDAVQLCAQALCLEEMLGIAVFLGAFFYGEPRRRLEVAFTAELRSRTVSLAATMHQLFRNGMTPAAQPGPHCRKCSLVNLCLPRSTDGTVDARGWLDRQLRRLSSAGSDLEDRPAGDEAF